MEFLQWFNQFLSVAMFSIVTLVVNIVAVAILRFFQKRSPNKGLTFFTYAFISGIISNIIYIVMDAVWTWVISSHPPTIIQIISVVNGGLWIAFSILFAVLVSRGLLCLLGYEGRINCWAMVGGALAIASMYLPWYQIRANFVALTYTFPGAEYTSDIVALMCIIAHLLLLISAYLSFIGSVFSGNMGYTLIVVSGILTLIAPFTFIGTIGAANPWVGLAIPFIATIVLFYALSVHPKELQKTTQKT